MSDKPDTAERRRHLRFPAPMSMKTVHVDPVFDADHPFTTFYLGLAVEMSSSGMKIVLANQEFLKPGNQCRVKFGRENIFSSKIVWSEDLKYSLTVFGLEFIQRIRPDDIRKT